MKYLLIALALLATSCLTSGCYSTVSRGDEISREYEKLKTKDIASEMQSIAIGHRLEVTESELKIEQAAREELQEQLAQVTSNQEEISNTLIEAVEAKKAAEERSAQLATDLLIAQEEKIGLNETVGNLQSELDALNGRCDTLEQKVSELQERCNCQKVVAKQASSPVPQAAPSYRYEWRTYCDRGKCYRMQVRVPNN